MYRHITRSVLVYKVQVDKEALLLWYEVYAVSQGTWCSGNVTTAVLLTLPDMQVKSGGLAARVATEGVMLQYAVDAHLDELLAHLWVQVRGQEGEVGAGKRTGRAVATTSVSDFRSGA